MSAARKQQPETERTEPMNDITNAALVDPLPMNEPGSPPSSRAKRREPLSAISARIGKALSGAASEPLAIAATVVALAEDWNAYQAEAGGLSATQWLTKTFGAGRDLRWFEDRNRAVLRLGEASRRTWDHGAAVWALNAIPSDADLRKLNEEVLSYRRKNGLNPPSLATVRTMAEDLGIRGKPRRYTKQCARCDRMAAALLAAGLTVPD